MSVVLKRSAGFFIAPLLITAPAWSGEPGFDARVSQARRRMRVSCMAVKKAMKAPQERRGELRATAVEEARRAEAAWRAIADNFAEDIPDGYAGDPMWGRRLEDIVLNMERMRTSLENGELRAGFLACAHTCGLIGAMHEANGVHLPVDAMAALRKKVRVLQGLIAAGAPGAARTVPEVLRLRDDVLLTPAPAFPSREAYLAALPGLSAAVDAVAAAVRDGGDLNAAVQDLAATVEGVYELSL